MKITDLKVFHINPGKKVSFGTGWGKNFTLVKLYTDEGIDGVGEAFGTGKAKTIEAALLEYRRWLVGQDPTEVVRNWYAYYRGSRYPLGTATLAALSGVEQAMWDIAGKACGLPVYKMLGGPVRDKVRVYASGYLAQPKHFFEEGLDLVDAANYVVEQGFTALKITPQPDDWKGKSPIRIHRDSVERVRAVREAVGPDIDICLDYHGRSFSPVEAVKLAREIEPYHPMFLEEPSLTTNPDSLVWTKSMTSIPIAAGERCVTREQTREVLEKEAVHILQPEPMANGGISETIRWAYLAELHHIQIAPHHACSPVSLASCGHIDAVIPNFIIQECNVDLDEPFIKEVFRDLPRIVGGYLEISDRPGLGVSFNEKAAERYEFKPFDRPVVRLEDGSIGLE